MTDMAKKSVPDVSLENFSYDDKMEDILCGMLEADEDITARGVIRHHPSLSAASSITRNPARAEMLAKYQARQLEFRGWRSRLAKRSKDSTAMSMAEKDFRISELERQVEILTASHVAMLRVVGELGGYSKWAKFFETYKDIRNDLVKMGAMPTAKVIHLDDKDQ